ncbi:nicotinate-nucleotide--dimethylbenzimidazole phosphoribosyltransferase [Actinopolyspora mortivallis]|uniref:nicotinate-nucleotide--dimethylbenzimidazole phosphoribosyltransferase n=1 Tax=Actinopolyspora mortivallis TaxID=33906 RepID=UPI00047A9FD8|nr:nicotinate-nucleotide--dimethylbenzimidazole phosphoribosyltransferase [Actinopolyspora mortivallis]
MSDSPSATPSADDDSHSAVEFGVVPQPDEQAHRQAIARHGELTKPAGSLGRLEELGVWVAARQGVCPPRPFARPRVVVFAGDHGVADDGVSAYPKEVTAQMVANIRSGGAAVNALAANAGASVRVVDMAVDGTTAEAVSTHKVRRSSGTLHTEDALTPRQARSAVLAGRTLADEEIDAGADLLVAGDMGIGNTTPAAVLTAALTSSEPVAVVGRGTGIDDAAWMRKTAAVRDGLRRARRVADDPLALLRTAGGADLAAMAGFLARASARGTPVILDGMVVGAAALVAEELAPGAVRWWLAGHRSVEPAASIVLDQLDLSPVLDLDMRLGEGSGAVTALPVVNAAVRVLAEMSTFEQAGIQGPTADEAVGPVASGSGD